MGKLFLSHQLEVLARYLAEELGKNFYSPLAPHIILVSNSFVKQWLLLQLVQHSSEKIVAGCRIYTAYEGLCKLFHTGFQPATSTKIVCAIFKYLMKTKDPELCSYLKAAGQNEVQRAVRLSERLAELFLRYGNFDPELFQPSSQEMNWQKRLIQELFVHGNLRCPVQLLSKTMRLQGVGSIHCFGLDFLPLPFWKALSSYSIYLFSPCTMYWADLCTHHQRKYLDRCCQQKGVVESKRAELDAYLTDAPPLLANWGASGRAVLQCLDQFDLEIEQDEEENEEISSSLHRLQRSLLHFHVGPKLDAIIDPSVQLVKAGSSYLEELKQIKCILIQMAQEHGIAFSEMRVLAPEISPYVPLIEFVFSDLPYRIAGVDFGVKSFFYQGVHQLFDLANSEKMETEDVLALLDNPLFIQDKDIDMDLFRQQLSLSKYCCDLQKSLLEQCVFLFPEQNVQHEVPFQQIELWLQLLQKIQHIADGLRTQKTLQHWGSFLKESVDCSFSTDFSDDADMAARKFFQNVVQELLKTQVDEELYPCALIQKLLKGSSSEGQIHSSYLHAIQFSSLKDGAALPAKVVALIGMSEEQFPRQPLISSLDLFQKDPFSLPDQDRYLLLQTIFSARRCLILSYCHISPEDGKQVNPSFLIEELLFSLDSPPKEIVFSQAVRPAEHAASIEWPETFSSEPLHEGETTISLADLVAVARNPWAFYLKKHFGLFIEDREEVSFSRQKGRFLRMNATGKFRGEPEQYFPRGFCGETLQRDCVDVLQKWEDQLKAWDVCIEPASFLESCQKVKKEEGRWVLPSLKFSISERLVVKITGDISTFSMKGFVHVGEDSLDGLLHVWPECLVTAVATGCFDLFCLKTGRVRHLENPKEALRQFILYFFKALSAPSPLLTEWADVLLRKGPVELDRKMRNWLLGKSIRFADPVFEWVSSRTSLPSAAIWAAHWGPYLKESFSELSALYTRGKNAAF